MIKLFSLFIMLLIAICSTNLQAQVQERAANQQDFEATKTTMNQS